VGHVLYTLRVLQIQSADIVNTLEREQALQLVSTVSLINVAIQSIPLVVLAGLLRHPAVGAWDPSLDTLDGADAPHLRQPCQKST
jgi:hypothetical protein